MAVQLEIFQSSFVVRNITDVAVNILGAIVHPNHEVDLFAAVPALSETTVINALSKPRGQIYLNVNIFLTIEIVSYSLVVLGQTVTETSSTSFLFMPQASVVSDGYLSKEDFARFSNSTTAVVAPLAVNASAISISQAGSLSDGYLSRTDWVRFNSAAGGGLTPIDHESLRQLIHLADRGPFEGFTSGAFREVLPVASPFPTSVIWWTNSGKTSKIVEKTITYGNIKAKISQIRFKVYDVDGSTVLATVTDDIAYSGIFETSRTRTIV